MTCTNIFWGQTLLKLLKLLGYTQKYKKVQEFIVWLSGFLKYAHKLQGCMHLATQDALLLNLIDDNKILPLTQIVLHFCTFV